MIVCVYVFRRTYHVNVVPFRRNYYLRIRLVWVVESLSSFDQDCSNCPDLVPTLVFLALGIKGTSYIRNIRVLKFKESDRIGWVLRILDEVGATYEYDEAEDYLSVTGIFKNNKKIHFKLPSDHRMIMLASMIIRAGKVDGSVNNVFHVNKSYPKFFDHLVKEE